MGISVRRVQEEPQALERVETARTIDSVFNEFQLNNKVKNLSKRTITFYHENTVAFRNFLEGEGINDIGNVTKNIFNSYVLWLMDKQKNETTVNTYLSAARVFLYYCMAEGYMQEFKIKLKQPEQKIKEPYTEEEIKKLIKPPKLRTCRFSVYRNWVLVQYFLDTGNRLRTVRNLKVKDINLDAAMATIRTTKNKVQHYSPLSKTMVKNLDKYIRVWGLQPKDYLFPNSKRQKLTTDGMRNAIVKYNRKRGVNKTSVHAFRHTFARNYIVSGGDAFKLQRLLGHKSISMTLRYVALYAPDLAEDFAHYSILEKHNSTQNRIKRQRKGK